MIFGEGYFWGPAVATLAMIVGAIIAWLLVSWSRSTAPQNPTAEKTTTYACGEDVKVKRSVVSDIEIDETRPHGERFFSPIYEVFRGFYDYIRPSHTGVLSTYLLWIVVGTIIFLVGILIFL